MPRGACPKPPLPGRVHIRYSAIGKASGLLCAQSELKGDSESELPPSPPIHPSKAN